MQFNFYQFHIIVAPVKHYFGLLGFGFGKEPRGELYQCYFIELFIVTFKIHLGIYV